MCKKLGVNSSLCYLVKFGRSSFVVETEWCIIMTARTMYNSVFALCTKSLVNLTTEGDISWLRPVTSAVLNRGGEAHDGSVR